MELSGSMLVATQITKGPFLLSLEVTGLLLPSLLGLLGATGPAHEEEYTDHSLSLATSSAVATLLPSGALSAGSLACHLYYIGG